MSNEKELPQHCCGRCEFYRPDKFFGGGRTCHRGKPEVMAMQQPGVKLADVRGGVSQPQIQVHSYFPPMDADDWGCGFFEPVKEEAA